MNKQTKIEAKPDTEITNTLCNYDFHVAAAKAALVRFCTLINERNIPRYAVTASVMAARNCTFETALSYTARLKHVTEYPQILEGVELELTVKRPKARNSRH